MDSPTPHYLGLNKPPTPSYNQDMTKHTWPLFTFIFFGLTIAAPALMVVLEKRRLSNAFKSLAQCCNLRFYPGERLQSPRLAGYYQGRSLSVDTHHPGARGGGLHLRVVLDVNAPPQAYLRLKTRNAIQQINPFPQRWTDDPDFDSRFVITSQPDTYANALLGRRSQLRSALQGVPSMHYNVDYTLEVKAGSVVFEQVNPATDVEQLGSILRLLDNFASAVEQTV